MEFVLLAALVALAWKLVDTVKSARSKDWNAVITQLAVWAAGVAVVWVGAATTWASGVEIQGVLMSDFDWAEKVLFGASLLSIGSVGYDFKKAFDNTDTAKLPPLTNITPPAPPAG